MLLFWTAAALLLLIALAFILPPLLKTPARENNSEAGREAHYRQRLQEIETELEQGLISPAQAGAIKRQAQHALLDWDKNKQPAATADKGRAGALITIAAFIPLFAIGLYHYLGQPEAIAQAALIAGFEQAETEAEKRAALDNMLAQLERRLAEQPGDTAEEIEGWLMLANSYSALQRYPEAARAAANLYRLRPDDPDTLFRYADSLATANEGMFAGRPAELIQQGLASDPENPGGLWLAGLAAQQAGDNQGAIRHWERLLPQLEPGSAPAERLQQQLRLARGQAAAADVDDKVALRIQVSLLASLKQRARPDAALFIYATALTGPPMPIAIVRKKAGDLPVQVQLDDASAMLPGSTLSNHAEVQLIARVSNSGNARPQSGDLIGRVNAISTRHKGVIRLVIDKRIP